MVNHHSVLNKFSSKKKCKRDVKTFFNQTSKKKKRSMNRSKKKIYIMSNLRPLVHGQTAAYNTRIKFGKGFSFAELKDKSISIKKARSMGISFDKRRKKTNLLGSINVNRVLEFYHNNIYSKNKIQKIKKNRRILSEFKIKKIATNDFNIKKNYLLMNKNLLTYNNFS